jgi:hypothetical protein
MVPMKKETRAKLEQVAREAGLIKSSAGKAR